MSIPTQNKSNSCRNCAACTMLANFQKGMSNLTSQHLTQLKDLANKIVQQKINRVRVVGFSYSMTADTSKANKGAERAQLVTKVLRGFLDKIKPGLSRTVVFMVKSKVKPNVTDAAQQTMLRKVKVCAQGASQAPHSPKSFAGGGRRPMPARRGRREMELHETALGEIFNEVFA